MFIRHRGHHGTKCPHGIGPRILGGTTGKRPHNQTAMAPRCQRSKAHLWQKRAGDCASPHSAMVSARAGWSPRSKHHGLQHMRCTTKSLSPYRIVGLLGVHIMEGVAKTLFAQRWSFYWAPDGKICWLGPWPVKDVCDGKHILKVKHLWFLLKPTHHYKLLPPCVLWLLRFPTGH